MDRPGALPAAPILGSRIGSSPHAVIRAAALGHAAVMAKSFLALHSPSAFGLAASRVQDLNALYLEDVRILWEARHPNLAQLFGVVYDSFGTAIWAVSEQADWILEDHAFLSERSCAFGSILAYDLLAGLSFLHQRDLCHGNLKPSNVLFVHSTFKLADPSPSAFRSHLQSIFPIFSAFSLFSAPEHMGGGASAAGDLFSAAMVLAQAYQPEALPALLSLRIACAQSAWGGVPALQAAVCTLAAEQPISRGSASEVLAGLPPPDFHRNSVVAAIARAKHALAQARQVHGSSGLLLVSQSVAPETLPSNLSVPVAPSAPRSPAPAAAAHILSATMLATVSISPQPTDELLPSHPAATESACQTHGTDTASADTQTDAPLAPPTASANTQTAAVVPSTASADTQTAAAGPADAADSASQPVVEPATADTAARASSGAPEVQAKAQAVLTAPAVARSEAEAQTELAAPSPATTLATMELAALDRVIADPATVQAMLGQLAAMATESLEGLRALLAALARAAPQEIGAVLLAGENTAMLFNAILAADSQAREALFKILAAFAFKNSPGQAHLLRSGAVPAIVRSMAADVVVPAVQEHACRVLSSLALCADEWKPAWRGPAAEAAVRALRFCPDPAGLVLQACAVLSNLGASSEGQIAAVRAAGLGTVVGSMTRHGSNAAVQEQACRALRSLAGRNGENQAALIEAGGAVAVVRAMFQHWASPGVIEQALRVLREVTKSASSSSTPPTAAKWSSLSPFRAKPKDAVPEPAADLDAMPEGDVLVDAQAVHAVVRAMGAHPGSAVIQELGLTILRVLTYRNAENQVLVARRGGVSAMVLAMRSHPNALPVQEEACRLIANLAENAPAAVAAEALSPRVVQAVQAAVQTHPRNTHIEVCSHLLRRV